MYERLCYRNPLCGQEQQMEATLIARWLVWAWILWFHFLLYCFWCCLLFFLVNHCHLHFPWSSTLLVLLFFCGTPSWPIIVCLFLLIYCQFSFLGNSQSPYLHIWMLPTPDWLHQSPLPALDSFRTPHYIYSASHCIVSLVSSMQSSIVSSPTLKETDT